MIGHQKIATPEGSDDVHARLMAAAEAADREIAPEHQEPAASAEQAAEPQEQTEVAQSEQKPTDSPEPSAETPERPRDDKGRFLKKTENAQHKEEPEPEPGPEPEAEAPKELKPESEYSKAKKEQERFDRNWEKFQQEKEQFRQWADQTKREFEQLKQQPQQPARFGSQEYLKAELAFKQEAAKKMREGDIEGAQAELAKADSCRVESQRVYQVEQQEAHQKFSDDWARDADAIIEQYPTLGEAGSSDSEAVAKVLKDYPVLGYVKGGFGMAVQWLINERDAAEASGLREENQKLATELEQLRKRMTPADGKPAGHSAVRGFDSMTMEQKREHLRAAAEAADAA